MSRTSCDQYKLPNGIIVNITKAEHLDHVLKDGATLWNGYNYDTQQWYHNGAPDTRTLEELTEAMGMNARQRLGAQCPACHGLLREPEVMNSLSRYCSAYICSDCGTREAFEGFFWQSNAIAQGNIEI